MTSPRQTALPPRSDTSSTAARRVRDPYADLLRDTRGLRREQVAARDAWFAGLAVERKEETLFELEMLLKGIAAWGNPRNHPMRDTRDHGVITQRNFRAHLLVVHTAMEHALVLAASLLGPQRHEIRVERNLPLGFSEEPRPEAISDAPDRALHSLTQSLRVSRELVSALLALDHIPYRVFYSAVLGVQREVSRNPFFNPLYALEFRPEFDRVRVPDVLDAILSVEGETAHRLVALMYLGTFRLTRMASLLHATLGDTAGFARAWVIAAALRVDARALAHVLRVRAPTLLGDALERELMRVPASEMRTRFDAVARECARLRRLCAALVTTGAALRAETRRLLQASLPACDALVEHASVAAGIKHACARLRETLQSSIVHVTWALRGSADPERLFGDRSARRTLGERLRSAAWMFSLMTRAFIASARESDTADHWSEGPTLGFAREYLAYYRSIGQLLAYETEYAHVDALTHAIVALRDADWVDAPHMHLAVQEAERFLAHLGSVIERTSAREELTGVVFDKSLVAETLRMHLGA